MEDGDIDVGNAQYGEQEAMIIIEDVFVPNELIFMDSEFEFASDLVERFTSYHRRSYVCKTGLGDVMIGAAATVADYNGVPNASHIRDKLVEMTHLNETIYSSGIAAPHGARQNPAIISATICSPMCASTTSHGSRMNCRASPGSRGWADGHRAVGTGSERRGHGAAAEKIPQGPV